MSRAPRVHIAGALYLVTSRALPSEEELFRDPADYDAYRGLLQEYQRRYGFTLYAYRLLPDAVHLCLEPANNHSVSMIMHDLTAGYTRHVNKRYDRAGSLFQGRYKEVLIEKQPQYLLAATTNDWQRMERWLDCRVVGSDAFVRQVREQRAGATKPEPTGLKLMPAMAAGLAIATFVAGGSIVWLRQPAETSVPTMTAAAPHAPVPAATAPAYAVAVYTTPYGGLMDLEGTSWEIQLKPAQAANGTPLEDALVFARHQVASHTLGTQSYPASNYTISRESDGSVVWKTMQTNARGDIICWRGEWQGTTMRGLMTQQTAGASVENHTFVGVMRQTPQVTRSEI